MSGLSCPSPPPTIEINTCAVDPTSLHTFADEAHVSWNNFVMKVMESVLPEFSAWRESQCGITGYQTKFNGNNLESVWFYCFFAFITLIYMSSDCQQLSVSGTCMQPSDMQQGPIFNYSSVKFCQLVFVQLVNYFHFKAFQQQSGHPCPFVPQTDFFFYQSVFKEIFLES